MDPLVVFAAAAQLCERRRAFLIIDPPVDQPTVAGIADWKEKLPRSRNAALYFPRVLIPDELNNNDLRSFAPSGVMAGVYSRTDTDRGVWKAPAGSNVDLRMVHSLTTVLSDAENAVLNPIAVNCLRSFPIFGNVAWSARTLVGADAQGDDYKYVPVRRLALYLEESLYRGTQWVVFEPNEEALWSQIRLNVGSFMHGLFRLGAFQGLTPRDAYFVRCDRETNDQADVDKGIVTFIGGIAPLKPAEFIIMQFRILKPAK